MYSTLLVEKVVGGTVRQVTSGAQVRRWYVRIRNRSGTGGHERSRHRHVTDVGSIYEPGWERPPFRNSKERGLSSTVLASPISVHCNCHSRSPKGKDTIVKDENIWILLHCTCVPVIDSRQNDESMVRSIGMRRWGDQNSRVLNQD